MNQSKSWKTFIIVVGLLTICFSPYASGDGSVDQATFFGGVITSLFGLFLVIRDKKR